jgi:NAD-dependent DNA ligase
MSKITKEQLQDSRNEFYDAIHDSIELLLIQVKKAGVVYYKHDDNFVSDKTYDDTVKILIQLYELIGITKTSDNFRENNCEKLARVFNSEIEEENFEEIKEMSI